jgi:hypothetical protein
MRYYTILILDPVTGKELQKYSSLNADGATIPGALNVEFDIPRVSLASPQGASYIRIWGIGIKDIGQANDLNRKIVQVYGGMAKGLPLANPQQAGLLLEGEITQAFGNWQRVNMTLDLIVQTSVGSAEVPANIVLNWKAGQTLSEALIATLTAAFPTRTVLSAISANLVQSHDEPAVFQTVVQLAQWAKQKTQAMLGGDYRGIDFVIKQKQFYIYDGTSSAVAKIIEFKDLIGQPTWIGPEIIQFKTVMRADVDVPDFVELPKGQVTNTAQSYSQYRDQSQFTGIFEIIGARSVGCYRQRDGNSWVTVFDAFPQRKTA